MLSEREGGIAREIHARVSSDRELHVARLAHERVTGREAVRREQLTPSDARGRLPFEVAASGAKM